MSGRIPKNFIDDLLNRTDIVDLIDSYVSLRKAGSNYQALCPFHDEKTPSFSVSREKQFYHCFGCGANGNAISFLMEYNRMEFVDTVEDLAARAGLEVPHENDRFNKDSNLAELYELLELVTQFYCRQLREHKQAQRAVDYLKQRGISGELAAKFELGYAPPGWDNLLNALGKSDAAQKRLSKAGMIIQREKGGYYDRFRDRIMYPIRDQRGRAIGFGGRVLDDDTPKYLNSPETPVFSKGRELYGLYQARHANKNIERLYIVEGYMDVLALVQHGVTNVAATLGTAATTDHIDRIFRTTTQIVFCFDGDEAGKKAAWRALELSLPLLHGDRQAFFRFMPEGDDPDDFIRNQGIEAFKDSNFCTPLSDFLVEKLSSNAELISEQGRATLIEKAIPYLAAIKSQALRELVQKKLQEITRLEAQDIESLTSKSKTPQRGRKIRVNEKQQHKQLLRDAIRLLLHTPKLALKDNTVDELSDIEIQGIDFLKEIFALIRSNPDINCAGIIENWRDTRYGDRLGELASSEILLSDPEHIEIEFIETIRKIRKLNQPKQSEELTDTRSTHDLSDEQKNRLRDPTSFASAPSQK